MPVPQRDRAQEKLDKIKKVSRMKVMAGKLRGNGRLVLVCGARLRCSFI